MSVESLDEVRRLLDAGAFESMIGLDESEVFDAKAAHPYDLDVEAGRFELAKDASSFANEGGGAIVVGLATSRSSVDETDRVTSLDAIPVEGFDVGKIRGVLRDYLYPEIVGLRVYWQPGNHEPGLGVGVIDIPEQSNDRKPFLITRVFDETGPIKKIVFGYARRVGADSIPHDVRQLQRAMQTGTLTVAQRLTGLDEKVTALLASMPQLPAATGSPAFNEFRDKLHARVRDVLEKVQ